MSTIHGPNSSGLKVNIDVTRQRQTPKTSFGDTLSAGINRTADTVAQASHAAAPFIPDDDSGSLVLPHDGPALAFASQAALAASSGDMVAVVDAPMAGGGEALARLAR